VARIDLDADGRRCRVLIALGVVVVGLFGELPEVEGQEPGLGALDHQVEALRAAFDVVGKRVEQVERVQDPEVERVAGERGLEAEAAGLDLTDAQLVDTENAVAAP